MYGQDCSYLANSVPCGQTENVARFSLNKIFPPGYFESEGQLLNVDDKVAGTLRRVVR